MTVLYQKLKDAARHSRLLQIIISEGSRRNRMKNLCLFRVKFMIGRLQSPHGPGSPLTSSQMIEEDIECFQGKPRSWVNYVVQMLIVVEHSRHLLVVDQVPSGMSAHHLRVDRS